MILRLEGYKAVAAPGKGDFVSHGYAARGGDWEGSEGLGAGG
jgi:hypothetical protein